MKKDNIMYRLVSGMAALAIGTGFGYLVDKAHQIPHKDLLDKDLPRSNDSVAVQRTHPVTDHFYNLYMRDFADADSVKTTPVLEAFRKLAKDTYTAKQSPSPLTQEGCTTYSNEATFITIPTGDTVARRTYTETYCIDKYDASAFAHSKTTLTVKDGDKTTQMTLGKQADARTGNIIKSLTIQ